MLDKKVQKVVSKCIEDWVRDSMPSVTEEQINDAGKNFVGFLNTVKAILDREDSNDEKC